MSNEHGNGAENLAAAPQGPIRSRRELRGSRANIRQDPQENASLRREATTDHAAPAATTPAAASTPAAATPTAEPTPAAEPTPTPAASPAARSDEGAGRVRGPRFAPVAQSATPVDDVVPAPAKQAASGGAASLLGPAAPNNGATPGNGAGAGNGTAGTGADKTKAAAPLLPGTSRPQGKKRKKRTGRSIVAFLVVVLALGGLGYFGTKMAMDFFNSKPSAGVTDYPGPGTGEVTIVIPEGASGAAIANVLVDAGVTANVERTIAVLANHPDATSIQPGTYTLKLQMRADAAVAALMDPANRADTGLTIPEGYVLTQVKTRLVEIGGFDAAEVEAALKDTTALGLPEVAKGNLEGWLAPATYEVGPSDTPVTLLKQMVALQKSRLEAAGVAEADFQTVLIKASILEREVNIDEYLPKVARVIENRLQDADGETRGLLQMDSTVLYGVGQVGGVPTQEQLAIDTPFNTYMHPGLPPAPIANPGERAIEVALAPAEGSWLYFVSINLDTGETLFASTLEEHEKNVKLYREFCETSDRC
ncbi:endolytic transglycosylase MltG [Buchananella felis]|uniref:endolytic transglycosylase MltG n=1 Tax=Buchananella felis TaxID=3231492 RepID=UPI0035276C52